MSRIVTKKPNKLGISLRPSRLTATMLIIAVIALISSTAYAMHYFWQQAHVTATPAVGISGRKAFDVTTENCYRDKTALYDKVEVKDSTSLSAEEVSSAISAACEYEAIYTWALKTWPDDFSKSDNQTPNYVSHIVLTQLSNPEHVVSLDGSSLRTDDTLRSEALGPSVVYIAEGKHASRSAIKQGDRIVVITQRTVEERNDADCTPSSCTRTSGSKQHDEIVAIVRLHSTEQDYRNGSRLIYLIPCDNNPVDQCPHPDTVTVFFRQGFEKIPSENIQATSGRLLSFDSAHFVLRTSSGRVVTVHTDQNIIGSFANDEYNQGFTIAVGDMLEVRYGHYQNTYLTTDIPSENLMQVWLITESNQTKTKY